MKILLLSLNSRYTHSNLALYYLRTAAKDSGFEVSIKELSINLQIIEIITEIYKSQPDVLAISVYIWNSELVAKLFPEIKQILPKCKIVLGGPEVSYNPDKWIENHPEIDFIVTGHGEAGFKFLLENYFTTNKKIINRQNPPFPEIEFPYIDEDFSELKDKYIYYESSRGCSYRCSYCLSSRSDQKLEYRDFEKVKAELTLLLFHKPKIIKFVDRTFNANKVFSRELWQFLINSGTKTKFHFEIFPTLLEDEDFEILKTAPVELFQFEIGIQSVNSEILEIIDRHDDWQVSSKNIKKLLDMQNIHIHTDLIAGLPGENFEQIKSSFNEIYGLNSHHFQLGFLKVLPGTKMQEQAEEFDIKYMQTPPYQVMSTSDLSFDEIIRLTEIEHLLNKFYNSGKYIETINFLCSQYENSFDFYGDLREYYEVNNLEVSNPNWQQNAKTLINFAEEIIPEYVHQLKDSIRWDWCKTANSHYFPDFLQTANLKQAKECGYEYLRNLSVKGVIDINEVKMTLSELKSAVFYIPETIEFALKHKIDDKIAVFVKDVKKKKITKIPFIEVK